MNFPNPVRQKIMAGQPSFGSFLNLVSPMAAEVLVDLGYEWLAVDAEHAQWDIGSMTNAFRAIEARGGIPMTRVESHDPTVLARTLDAGAMGVIVPHVSTVEQAQAIADACRYPPRGQRSSGSGRATINAEDGARINEEVLVCPQIEDMEGVNNIEAIMAVDGSRKPMRLSTRSMSRRSTPSLPGLRRMESQLGLLSRMLQKLVSWSSRDSRLSILEMICVC